MKRHYLLSILMVLLVCNSCNDDTLNQDNPNNPSDESYYQNEQQLTAGVNSGYAILQSTLLEGREHWFVHDLRADEMTRGTGGGLEVPRGEILDGKLTPGNAIMGSVWNGLYRLIHRMNVIIEKGPTAPEVTDTDIRDQRVAEAKFLRGWAYFELVSLWGPVPLYTTSVKAITDESQARASEEEVYARVIADLTDAAAVLPYIKDLADADLGRATKEAAQTVLARVYMFINDYTSARNELQKVITSPSNLRLVDDYFDNFTEEGEFNAESIWEIGYTTIGEFNWDINGGDDGAGGFNERSVRSQEYSAVGWRNLIPSVTLLNEHERPSLGDAKEDPRLHYNYYFLGDTYAGGAEVLDDDDVAGLTTTFDGITTKISWRKYSVMYKLNPGGFMTTGINHRMIRFAEVKLMMAECENELDAPEDVVLAHLNDIRKRPSINMPEYPTARYPTATKADRLKAIMHEKMVELAGEQIRNRDILRWRKQGKLTKEPLPYFEPNKYELLPIPQSEVDNNEKIGPADQNAGY